MTKKHPKFPDVMEGNGLKLEWRNGKWWLSGVKPFKRDNSEPLLWQPFEEPEQASSEQRTARKYGTWSRRHQAWYYKDERPPIPWLRLVGHNEDGKPTISDDCLLFIGTAIFIILFILSQIIP